MSENARRMARERFTIESLARSWSALYEEALQNPKRARHWNGSHGSDTTAAEIFIASLGEYGIDYTESMEREPNTSVLAADDRIAQGSELFRSKTRGSAFHYQTFSPDDPWLNLWCGLIQSNDGNCEDSYKHFIAAGKNLSKERVTRYMMRQHGSY